MIHRTPLLDVKLHAAGFYPLDATWEISRLPLIDRLHRLPSGECLFARLDYRDAVAWCNLHGCELPTAAQLEQARAAGLTIRPCVQFIAADLATCERHDALVWGWLAAAGWAHGVPVTGAGKHWVKGAPAGRSWLMGWWTERVEAYGSKRTGPGWVQQAPAAGSLGPHDDRHVDYSSTTLVVRRRGTVDVDGDTDPAGWTEAAAAAALDALRPTAAAVRAHVARLLDEGAREWSSTAERGGHVLPPGAGSQPGGHVLAAELAPHGWRCSVAELVADARALGTWREAGGGYLPRVGDLAISARAGGDPRKGGTGHVERVTWIGQPDPRIQSRTGIETIGGNESNTWIEAPIDVRAVVGWIAYPPALGARCVELARAELAAGVKERPGAAAHPRIQAYHAGARRGGSPRAGMDRHGSHGAPVLGAAASDEVAWCASAASWCCAQALG